MLKPIHVKNQLVVLGWLYFSISKIGHFYKSIVEMGDVSKEGGIREITRPTTIAQFKMEDAYNLCNVIEFFC
jgi:hypothetical protein